MAGWSPAKRLSLMIAVGIGLHNFAEGLAIGQSAVSRDIALAALLVIGFGLHNATEGFGIVAPLAGDTDAAGNPAPTQLGILGGHGPDRRCTDLFRHGHWIFVHQRRHQRGIPDLGGWSIIYVIIQLITVAAKAKRSDLFAYGLLLGLLAGFATDAIVTAGGADAQTRAPALVI